ncbi:MAG: hypothetical protein DRI34_07435 [Deltaproteobacteria bacterium]|nr:MAG: hypothetical protein DRI34_07435 [Deltaproteobacteria bacterium]
MKGKLLVLAGMLLSLPGGTPAAAGETGAHLALQRGLYLQYTRGDAREALRAYQQAAAEPALAEAALLRRQELLQVLGRGSESESLLALAGVPARLQDTLGQARLLPGQCEVVGRLDLQAVLKSRFVGQLEVKDQIEAGGIKLEELRRKLGFDPFSDISAVSFCATLAENPAGEMPVDNWLVVVEGRFPGFEPGALASLLGDRGQDSFTIKRRRLQGTDTLQIRLPLDQDPRRMQTVAVARPDEKLLLVGQPRTLECALAARAGRVAGLWGNRALRPVLERIPGGTTLWVAAMPGHMFDKLKKAGAVTGLPAKLPELDGLLLTVTLGRDIVVSAATRASDAESARLLADLTRGLLAVARLAPLDDELVRQVLGSIKVEAKDLDLQASVRVPGELVEREMKLERQQRQKKRVQRIKLHLVMKPGEKKTLRHQACSQAGKISLEKITTRPRGVVDCRVDTAGRLALTALKPGLARVEIDCGPGTSMKVEVEVGP